MKYPPFLGYPRLTGARKCHPTPGGVRQLSCMTSRQLSDGKMSVFDVIFCHNDCSVRVENSIARDVCLASVGKSHDAKQLPS